MRIIPSNTATATLRRVPFKLVDATDLITPEDITVTGEKVNLSVDGAADAASTNDIVKVDGAAGEYYIELTQTEANQTAGAFVRGWLQPTGCAMTVIQAQIGHSGVMSSTVTPDAGAIRDAVGLANANLDSQLEALPTAAENAAEVLSEAQSTPIHSAVQSVATGALTADALATDAVTEIAAGVVAAEKTLIDGLTADADTITLGDATEYDVTRDATHGYPTSISEAA